MRKILFLLCLFCLVQSASAVVINENIAFMGSGNGYLTNEDNSLDYFVVISAGSPNNIVLYNSQGTGVTIAYGNNTFNNPTTCHVASDGYLYFSSSNGVFRKLDRDTTPDDLGRSSEYILIATDTTVSAWSEDANYIYYYDKISKSIKRISKATYLVSNFKTFSTGYWVPDFCVVDQQDAYFFSASFYTSTTRMVLIKNDLQYAYQLGPSWGTTTDEVYYYGDIAYVNKSCIYIMGGAYCTGASPGFKQFTLRKMNDTGTAFTLVQDLATSNNMVTTGMSNTPVGRTIGLLGSRQPIYFYKDGTTINMMEMSVLAPAFGSSGSSGSSGAVNPLIDMNGDGQFTQDDAKDMALTLGPATWVFMFMIFLMVAMSMTAGGRR